MKILSTRTKEAINTGLAMARSRTIEKLSQDMAATIKNILAKKRWQKANEWGYLIRKWSRIQLGLRKEIHGFADTRDANLGSPDNIKRRVP